MFGIVKIFIFALGFILVLASVAIRLCIVIIKAAFHLTGHLIVYFGRRAKGYEVKYYG